MSDWREVPIQWLVSQRSERAGGSTVLPLLSVSIADGVTRRQEDGQAPSLDLSDYKVAHRNDIVLNRMRAFQGAVGLAAECGLVSPDYTVMRVAAGDPHFFEYLMRSSWFVGQMTASLRGIGDPTASNVRTPRINFSDLGQLRVRVPDLELQRRIVAHLDVETSAIDALISRISRARALLDERDEAETYHAVHSQPYPRTPIRHLGRYINGYPFRPADHGDEGVPIVRIAQLLDPTADVDRYAGDPDSRCHIDNGDLIFSWSATLAVRVWDRGPAYLNQHLFKVLPAGQVDLRWLLYALRAAIQDLTPHMHGSTMSHITKPMMSAVAVPLPPERVQRNLAAHIDEALERSESMRRASRRQIALLHERKQALITAAVTGNITV